MAFLGQEEQIREFQDRFRYLYAILFLGLGLLLCRLVYLQILRGDQMRRYSEENRIKRVKVEAPRGMIFDRNRTLLIDNRPAFDLEVTPQYLHLGQTKQVISMLSKFVKMPQSEIEDILDRNRGQPSFMPIKVKTDLSRDEVAVIESWKISMPGVDVKEEIRRTNIYGDIASHLLGYIGEVNPTELPTINKSGAKYKLGDNIGKFGLEQKMEDYLRGVDGEDIKEVDALGRVKLDRGGKGRVLSTNPSKAAVPGKNMVLTIDQDLQLAATKAFGDKIGSLVAIDPRNGQVLAMLSRPSFDPTEFARGISPQLWTKLLNNENHPLRDKTIQDHYPPGSTFKLVTAIAGLQEGVIDENTKFHCPGFLQVGNRAYHCWNHKGHGDVNVVTALTQSCDVFFYHVALKLKSVDEIAKWAVALGMGKRSGISLSREIAGLMPTEQWKQQRYHAPWTAGETVNVAIGQGYVLATALQLANAYATLANGGTLYRPYLIKQVESSDGQIIETFEPEVINKVPLTPKTVELVKQGLWGVTNTPHGTAYATARLPGMDFVGKTGSAQVVRITSGHPTKCENMKFSERDNALFVGFAPVKDPSIAVAVVVEHACHGGSSAAPVAREVVKTYLQKYWPDIYGDKAVAARLKAQGEPLHVSKKNAAESIDEDVKSDDEHLPTPEEKEQSAPPPAPPLEEDR